MFVVKAVGGHLIDNAISASERASAGKGSVLLPQSARRAVPVQPMTLTLKGSHVTAAPIQEMAARIAGNFFEIQGDVEFQPVAGRSYVVRGQLKKEGSTVWIETADTGEVVGAKVVAKTKG